MSKTDDLGSWRAFVTFARSGTLSAAAKALDVEPSSVSRSIASLEKSLGRELISHSTRPLQLTDTGKTALVKMESILKAHDTLMDKIRGENRAFTGTIRLSTAPGFATRQLVPLLREFSKEFPGISIDIQTGLKEADVAKGVCDVAVLTGEPTLSGLVYMSRGRNVYLPVASPAYVKQHGLPLEPADLMAHRGYVYAGPVRQETRFLFRGERSEAVQFASSVRSTDVLAVREAVLSGMGVAVDLPLVQIHEDLLEGRLVPILPGWRLPPYECFVVTNKYDWHMRRIRVFFKWYAKANQKLFSSFEESVSHIVGFPPDRPPLDRDTVFSTDSKRERKA